MEGKRKFFDPVVWARHCFILSLVLTGIVLSGLAAILTEKLFGPDNCISVFIAFIIFPLGWFFLAALLTIFVGSSISLFGLLVTRQKRIKPYLCVLGSVVIGFMAIWLLVNEHQRSREYAGKIICQSDLKYLTTSVLQIFENQDGMFKKDNWCNSVKDNIISENEFRCPFDKTGPCSYAMNENIPTAANALPEDLVVLFESAPGWNRVGGPNDVVTDRHKPPGANIAFADGRAEFVEATEIPKLQWTMEE